MKHFNKIILTVIFLLFLTSGVYGQTQSMTALTYHIGKSNSNGFELAGRGYFVGVGYQMNVWKDYLRFNPKLTVGSYDSKSFIGMPDEVFTNINLEVPLFFDFIRYKSFSLFIGTGGVLRKSYGLVGNGGNLGDMVYNSYYYQQWDYGVFMGCGISYSPAKSNFFIHFQPVNYCYFVGDWIDSFSSIGFGIKLPNAPAR